jgi:UDP-glucose 4-epimerase
MKIAILGTGFIGLNLLDFAIKKGFFVSVLSHHPCPKKYDKPSIKWICGDLKNASDVYEVLFESDIVYDLISNSVPGDLMSVSKDLFENVSYTLQLLEICTKCNIKQIIFTSSSSIYGDQKNIPISETSLPNPISSHAIQKITLEYYIKLYSRNHNLKSKIVRLSNPYGPGQNIYGRQGFIAIVFGQAIRGSSVLIRGDGETVRDYIYIDDVIDYLIELPYIKTNEITFNIGSGIGYSLNQVVNKIEILMDRKIKCKFEKKRTVDIAKSILDVNKTNIIIQNKPLIDMDQGLRKFLSFIQSGL